MENWLYGFPRQHSWICTSRRVNGFLGLLNGRLDHKTHTFNMISASIRFFAENLVKRSMLAKAHVHRHVATSRGDDLSLRKLALEILDLEYGRVSTNMWQSIYAGLVAGVFWWRVLAHEQALVRYRGL
jgi:hypothetical protein